MIPIKCPTCGRAGTIPNDRLNTRMHCKKCDAVFHMDRSGKIMLGEPHVASKGKPNAPPAKGGKGGGGKSGGGKSSPAKAPVRKAQRDESSGLSAALAAMPGWSKALVVVLALLIVMWQFKLFPKLSFKSKYGADLNSRVAFVGGAFCDNDINGIKAVTTAESRDAIGQWYDQVRPRFKYEGPQKAGTYCEFRQFEGNKAPTQVEIAIQIVPPPPATTPDEVEQRKKDKTGKPYMISGYDSYGSFDLATYWVRKGNGPWELDGTKMLEALKSPPTTDTTKKK